MFILKDLQKMTPSFFLNSQNILKGMWRVGPQNKGNSPSILFPTTPVIAMDGTKRAVLLSSHHWFCSRFVPKKEEHKFLVSANYSILRGWHGCHKSCIPRHHVKKGNRCPSRILVAKWWWKGDMVSRVTYICKYALPLVGYGVIKTCTWCPSALF